MTTHDLAPALLVEMETTFSVQLRTRTTSGETCSRGMSLYRKIVRENIGGVLQRVFPLYCQRIKDADIQALADAFLHQHQASQPEFHQVATEWLLFMRQQRQLSPHDLALIEYEWLMYAVEIDDSHVPPPQKMSQPLASTGDVDVARNPTLKLVALPFQIHEGEPCSEDEGRLNYYALYRKHNNALYQKRLSQIDVRLLSAINHQIISAERLLNAASRILADFCLRSWLETNNNDELLSLKYKG